MNSYFEHAKQEEPELMEVFNKLEEWLLAHPKQQIFTVDSFNFENVSEEDLIEAMYALCRSMFWRQEFMVRRNGVLLGKHFESTICFSKNIYGKFNERIRIKDKDIVKVWVIYKRKEISQERMLEIQKEVHEAIGDDQESDDY